MKKNRSFDIQKDSTLYKSNLRIHGNLWKVYTAALALGVIFVVAKGLISG